MASRKTIAGGFALETSISHLIHRAQQIAALQSADILKEAGITLRQFSVLAAVADSEGASQADIVERTGIDRSTLADMVSRMEKSGLLKRKQSKHDARAKSVSLMAKGRKALTVTRDGVAQADEALLEMLPSNRRAAFISSLSKLTGAAPAPAVEPVKAKKAPAKKKPATKKKTAAKKKPVARKASAKKAAPRKRPAAGKKPVAKKKTTVKKKAS